jgi:uncharacterized protein with PIN domain
MKPEDHKKHLLKVDEQNRCAACGQELPKPERDERQGEFTLDPSQQASLPRSAPQH